MRTRNDTKPLPHPTRQLAAREQLTLLTDRRGGDLVQLADVDHVARLWATDEDDYNKLRDHLYAWLTADDVDPHDSDPWPLG